MFFIKSTAIFWEVRVDCLAQLQRAELLMLLSFSQTLTLYPSLKYLHFFCMILLFIIVLGAHVWRVGLVLLLNSVSNILYCMKNKKACHSLLILFLKCTCVMCIVC